MKEYWETGKRSTSFTVSQRSIFSKAKGVLMDEVGGKVDHFTRFGSTQWDLCTPETYQELIDKFGIDKMEGYKEYEELRYVHNLDPNHKNIFTSISRNDGKLHPTEKPTDILKRLIKTHSRKGDTVLDCFCGSFSTIISCLGTGRHFIGFELDKEYYKWGQERIKAYLKMRNKTIEEIYK